MEDPQEPIIVLEGDAGVCTFATAIAATSHDYGNGPPREFFDAAGRRLRPVLEPETEEDHSADVRERVRRILRQVIQQPPDSSLFDYRETLSRFLEYEQDLSFHQFAAELAELLNPTGSPPSIQRESDVAMSVGSWGHYSTAAHHR